MCVIFNSNLDLLVALTKEKINRVLKENQHGALSRNVEILLALVGRGFPYYFFLYFHLPSSSLLH